MRHNTQHSLLHRRRHVADAAAASAPQHALRAIFILLVVVVMGSCLVVDALEEPTSSSLLQDVYELVPRYAINPTSMVLLLHDDGRLAAHDARDGTHMWSTHLRGGAMTKVVIDQAPTNATFFDDPFSVPFIVNGDGLYTHRPWKKISAIYDDVGELHAHPQQLPSSANNNNITATIHALREACFFMPLSALRRRELVQVGATDIYVTTSATIIDIDSSTGARLHPHGSTTSARRRWGPSTREGFTTTNIQEFDVDDVVEDDDAHDDERASIMYVPFHAVRYNAHIRAVKRGAYDWTITISQLRIAPRHAAMSAERDELARSNRFFSQVLRSDFAFDEESSSSSTKADASAQEVYVIEEINATHAALVRSMGNVRHLMWSVPITCLDGTSTTTPTTSKDQPRCKHTVQDELFLPEGHRITSAFAWLRHNNAVVRLRVDRHRSLDERLRTALTDFAVAGGALHTRVLHMGHALDYYAPPLGDGGGEGTSSSSSSSRGDVVAPTYYNDDVDLFAEDFEGNELEKYFRRGLLPDDALYPMDGDDQHHLFHDNNVFMDADVVVVERGITWRTAVAAGIHIACFACSVGLLCAGIPPRSRLQRAWAQADRGLRGQVVSRPTSTKLLPSDPLLVAQSTNTEDSDAYGHAMMLHGDADAGVERGALSHGSSSIDVFSRHLQASPPPWPMLDDDVATNTSSPPPYQQQQRGSLTRDESDEDEGTEWWRRARTSASMSDETEGELCPSPELRLFEQEFKVMKKIGSGAEGAVYCVEHHTTRAKYAIKVVRVDRQDEQRAIREAILHSSLYHPQVVRYFFSWTETLSRAVAQNLQLLELGDGLDGFSTSYRDHSDSMATSSYPSSSNMDDDDEDDDDDDDDQPYRMLFIQMEYYPCGTFADLLRERKRIDRVDNLRALREIAGGLEYVHGQDVIHRDLKPSNIFVSSAATKGLKIGDFGLAKRRGAKLTESALPSDVAGGTSTMNSVAGGTPLYASPELRRGDDVGKPSDIYSLAIIGVEMYAIFRTMHERILVLTEVRGGRYPPDMMEAYPEEVKLFSEMLQESPASRPSIRQVMARLKEIFLLERERNNAS